VLYTNATLSSLSIINITNGNTWSWTLSTFHWFYLFTFPWKLIVVIKNVPWFRQFLPHPLAGLKRWQLTYIIRSDKSRSTDSFRIDDNVGNQEMNKIPPPSRTRIIYRSNSKGFVILCNVKASDHQRKNFPLKLAEPGSGWQISSADRLFRIYQTKQNININDTTNRSHDVRKLQRQNWMFSFPTGLSVGRSYIR